MSILMTHQSLTRLGEKVGIGGEKRAKRRDCGLSVVPWGYGGSGDGEGC